MGGGTVDDIADERLQHGGHRDTARGMLNTLVAVGTHADWTPGSEPSSYPLNKGGAAKTERCRNEGGMEAVLESLLATTWSGVDWFIAAGSTATVWAAFGGAAVAVWYGRKAEARLDANAHSAGDTVVLAVQPSVRAVGVFRFKFHEEDGSQITVTEMHTTVGGLRQGRMWAQR